MMPDVLPTPLDYAPHSRTRKHVLRWIVICILAGAVGSVGKFAWDRVQPAIERHLQLRSSHAQIAAATNHPDALEWSEKPFVSNDPISDGPATLPALPMPTHTDQRTPTPAEVHLMRRTGRTRPFYQLVFAGEILTSDGTACIVLIDAHMFHVGQGASDPTATVLVETRATALRASRDLQPPQLVAFGLTPPFSLSNPRVTANRLTWDLVARDRRGTMTLTLLNDGKVELDHEWMR